MFREIKNERAARTALPSKNAPIPDPPGAQIPEGGEDAYRSIPNQSDEYTTEGINEHACEETFSELVAGIIFSGILFQLLIYFLRTGDRAASSMGLWIGVVLSVIMAFYLKKSVLDAIDIGEYGAEKVIKKGALIRYAIVVIVLGILMIFPRAGNPLAAFLGVMTLKVAAYIQPFTNKLFKIFKIRR